MTRPADGAWAPSEPGHAGGRAARVAARVLIRLRWFVIAFWVAACVVLTYVLPSLFQADSDSSLRGLLPEDTPAIATELRSVELFGFPLSGRTVVVQRDEEGLSPFDQSRTVVRAVDATLRPSLEMASLRGALPVTNALGAFPSSSESGTTALTYLLFDPDVSLGTQTRTARTYATEVLEPRDEVVGITGSVPARAAQGSIIRDALPLAETLTLGAIVLIVAVAFRSFVAPVVALLTTGVAFVMTLRLSGAVAEFFGTTTPSELEPVIIALLLGVVTDYVVFYLFALRREIARGSDRLAAATAATAAYGPIVAVAGLAVAAGTAALIFAQSLFFRALGPALVFTVIIALVVSVTLVPALMAVLGRVAFWPSRPRAAPEPEPEPEPAARPAPGSGPTPAPSRPPGRFVRLAQRRDVAAVAVVVVAAGLLLAATPLRGLSLGVSFIGSLPPESGVRQVADAARAGFAPGILSPTTVLVEGEDLDDQEDGLAALGERLEDQPGVAGVLGPGTLPGALDRRILVTPDGQAARYLVILDDPALGAAAIASLEGIEQDLPELLAASGLPPGTTSGVAGDTATAAFIVEQTTDDLLRIALAALGMNLLMLVIFLRAVVASVFLLLASLLSLSASLGITMLLFDTVSPGAGLTFYVPFAGAVLLLAFGSDYNIFAVGNIWEEARRRPLKEAIRRATPHSVAALLTAGLALAASFGLLSLVPLAPFRELAFLMFLGIALDVLLVRVVLVPELLILLGPASAWPSKRFARSVPPPAPAGDAPAAQP